MWLFLLLTVFYFDWGAGVWEFDEEASHYASGPAPRYSRREFHYREGQTEFLHRGVTNEELPFQTTFLAAMDGGRGVVTGSDRYDSVELHRVSPWVVEQIFRKGDAISVRARREVSPDGQTLRIVATGEGFRNVLLYRRRQ
jgi:hypothetical protein